MVAQARLILFATATGSEGVNPGLCFAGDNLLVDHWVHAICNCPRLLPLQNKVYIITSPETHGSYEQWAAERFNMPGAPRGPSIVCISQADGAQTSSLHGLSEVLDSIPNLHGCYLAISTVDGFFGRDFHLQRLIEHSIIRGKDMLAFTQPTPASRLLGEAVLQLEGVTNCIVGGNAQPRLQGVSLDPCGEADGLNDSVAVPFIVLHPNSVQEAQQALPGMPGALSGRQQYAWLAQSRIDVGWPVYGLHMDVAIDCGTTHGVLYAEGFMQYCATEEQKRKYRGVASEALAAVTVAAQEAATISRGDADVEALLVGASEEKQMLLKFDAVASDMIATKMTAAAQGTLSGSGTIHPGATGTSTLPIRFLDPTTRRYKVKVVHPLYETTSSEIGKLRPTEIDMPDVYAGNSQAFTNTFMGGPYRHKGLVTGVTRSKVHTLLNDF